METLPQILARHAAAEPAVNDDHVFVVLKRYDILVRYDEFYELAGAFYKTDFGFKLAGEIPTIARYYEQEFVKDFNLVFFDNESLENFLGAEFVVYDSYRESVITTKAYILSALEDSEPYLSQDHYDLIIEELDQY